jgi:hypothetical protein
MLQEPQPAAAMEDSTRVRPHHRTSPVKVDGSHQYLDKVPDRIRHLTRSVISMEMSAATPTVPSVKARLGTPDLSSVMHVHGRAEHT